MALGVQVTMSDLNYQAGQIAVNLNDYYNRAVEVKQYIDLVGVAGLVELGFTTDEANTLKTAFEDLSYQKDVSFDSSQAVRQLYGMGLRSVP
jgi:hypothetical protein